MYVVGTTAHFNGQSAETANDAANVCEHAVEVFLVHRHARAAHVKYKMYIDFYQCACHVVVMLSRGFNEPERKATGRVCNHP